MTAEIRIGDCGSEHSVDPEQPHTCCQYVAQRLALAEAVVKAVAAKHDARTVAELDKAFADEKIALDAYRRGTT
jgi:hypothetical protein